MRKTDKKIDKSIRLALTEVCELALQNVDGFKWLTHIANYDVFPERLSVVCVFESNEHLENARTTKKDDYLSKLIAAKLLGIDIKLKNIQQQIRFDTEEDCELKNNGNWHERLR